MLGVCADGVEVVEFEGVVFGPFDAVVDWLVAEPAWRVGGGAVFAEVFAEFFVSSGAASVGAGEAVSHRVHLAGWIGSSA